MEEHKPSAYLNKYGEVFRIGIPVRHYYGERPAKSEPYRYRVYTVLRFYERPAHWLPEKRIVWAVIETVDGIQRREPICCIHPYLVRVPG
jgi:hypothetical protein